MQNYYKSYHNYFWRWSDDYQVIEIPDGRTIVYREYLMEILQGLSGQGVPPLGSILLALAATNLGENEDLEILEDIVYKAITGWNNRARVDQEHLSVFYRAIDFLFILNQLPEKYRLKEGRMILFQMLFQEHQYLDKNFELDADVFTLPVSKQEGVNESTFLKDFKHFAKLVKEMPTVETVLKRLSDLPEVEEELDMEEEEGSDPKTFLEELEENPTTFPLAALIPPLWAGLKIPINQALPSQQRLGGVSDITNKGDFDQLLISEFAHDDLLFLSRIANQEALYIQREQPPVSDAFKRAILIDISIFNWGTPKLINFALALAIAEHPRAKEDCEIFLTGSATIPASLKTVDEVIQNLQYVDAGLDASQGIKDFFESYPESQKVEVFLISQEESMKEAAMQRVLHEYRSKIKYSLITKDKGTVAFYKHQKSTKRLIQKIQLNLEKYWANPPKEKVVKAILPDFDSPLLYPIPPSIKRVLLAPDQSVFMVTSDGTLVKPYRGTGRDKGCVKLLEGLKLNWFFSIGLTKEGHYLFFRMNPQNRGVLIKNLSTGKEWQGFFHAWYSSAYGDFIYKNDAFHFYGSNRYWELKPVAGEVVVTQSTELPTDWKEYYQEHQALTQSIKQSYTYKASVLKNIKKVCINDDGGLMLNKHELYRNMHGVIKLELNTNVKPLEIAEPIAGGFVFKDGSRIEVNRLGMLLLRSSNPHLPVVYVPTVLDAALGLATENTFAGYDYYQNPDEKQDVIDTGYFFEDFVHSFIEHILLENDCFNH